MRLIVLYKEGARFPVVINAKTDEDVSHLVTRVEFVFDVNTKERRAAVTFLANKVVMEVETPELADICPNCGADRTGKGSLLFEGRSFCDESCCSQWRSAILEENHRDQPG